MVRDYPDDFSGDEWLWYIANFRVSDPKNFYDTRVEYFLEKPIFDHLDKDQVMDLRDKILACIKTNKSKASKEEKQYLSYKKDDGEVIKNIEWFNVDVHNEIINVVPDHQESCL